jgi:hypothetical protein
MKMVNTVEPSATFPGRCIVCGGPCPSYVRTAWHQPGFRKYSPLRQRLAEVVASKEILESLGGSKASG